MDTVFWQGKIVDNKSKANGHSHICVVTVIFEVVLPDFEKPKSALKLKIENQNKNIRNYSCWFFTIENWAFQHDIYWDQTKTIFSIILNILITDLMRLIIENSV